MPFGWSGHPSSGPRDCHAVKASFFLLLLLIEETTPGTQSGSASTEAPRVRRRARQCWIVGIKEQQQPAAQDKTVSIVEVAYSSRKAGGQAGAARAAAGQTAELN